MPEFNYLKHNESDFPSLGNVDVYKYDNSIDYARYNATQMELMICSVPWDMGEAHIGNRTISGIGNVVYFGSKAKRDAWFDDIPDSKCYRFETKYKELHRDMYCDVPVPFDMCAKHNYLKVRYSMFANDNSPMQYEESNGIRDWFYFIRDVEFLAPNTTRLHLLDDAFQTWIYDVNVSGMVLERGHAPMFEMTATNYLKNPIGKNEYLLTEDVNFGEAATVKDIEAVVLNDGDMYACIATTGQPTGSWSYNVPAAAYYNEQGQPSVRVFAMAASNLNSFLSNITSNIPQFKQTVQAVWFASEKLITLGSTFTFGGVTCYYVGGTRKTLDLCKLDKDMFGYPTRYEEMAKLYTMPYAHIEITDESGNVDIVKIEDSTGDLKVNAAINLAYPFISIDAQIAGVGGSASKSLSFKNLSSHSITLKGQWYETLHTWQVPVFAVVLDPSVEYDYSTHFDRAQRVVDYTAAQNNENALADTHKANADDSAQTIVDNAALTAAATTAIAAASTASATATADTAKTYDANMTSVANAIVSANATSTIAANEQQASISATATGITSAVSAISAAATGDIAGAIGSAVGGLVGAAATISSASVGNALTATQAGNMSAQNSLNSVFSQAKTGADAVTQNTATNSIAQANNSNTTGSAANNAATMSANAGRDQTTQKANATRNANAAASAISNDVAQAALRAPFIYGSFENGDTSTTKPMALMAHVVTQSKHAIRMAGDEFARYGYMFDGQWDFDGNWNIGKYFTYWKLRDFWVSNLQVPDMYMDRLRFFLFGGVTVWRKPEYIGKIDLYDNF